MARSSKKIIKYRNSVLPKNLGEILSNADENDLKILVALMMAADENGEIPEGFSVSDALGDEGISVDASVKFWQGAGIITAVKGASKAKEKAKVPVDAQGSIAAVPSVDNTAHRNGAVEQSNGVNNYHTDELADLFEKRTVTAEFIDEAQRVFGKTFNSYDTGIVVGLVDQLGFEEEAVLSILAHMVKVGKKGVRYCEKFALSLYDEGYTRARDVSDRIAVIERSSHIISKIRRLYGIGDRALSQTEKNLFEKWTQKFEYDIDVIKYAYDITVDNTQKSAPKYTNAILENWYSMSLRTLEEIKSYEAQNKKEERKDKNNNNDKSYDLDGFFEAALQRSYEDVK